MDYSVFGIPTEIFLIVFLVLAAILLSTILIQALWNSTLPEICRFSPITFWQAFKLLLLGGLLSGSIGGCYRNNSNTTVVAPPQPPPAIYIGQPPYELKK